MKELPEKVISLYIGDCLGEFLLVRASIFSRASLFPSYQV
jgi:hypothetical protein